jgi:hypothetical protein
LRESNILNLPPSSLHSRPIYKSRLIKIRESGYTFSLKISTERFLLRSSIKTLSGFVVLFLFQGIESRLRSEAVQGADAQAFVYMLEASILKVEESQFFNPLPRIQRDINVWFIRLHVGWSRSSICNRRCIEIGIQLVSGLSRSSGSISKLVDRLSRRTLTKKCCSDIRKLKVGGRGSKTVSDIGLTGDGRRENENGGGE